jgi:anthranilate/para-aminobenzoate synthase component I
VNEAAPTSGQAAHLLRRLRERSPGALATSYLLHRPAEDLAVVGLGSSRLAQYRRGVLTVRRPDAPPEHLRCAERDVFSALRGALLPGLPAFFVSSLDLRRSARDPALPLFVLVQPAAEVRLARSGLADLKTFPAGHTGSPAPEALREAIASLPRPSEPGAPLPRPVDAAACLRTWLGDSDEAFRARIGEVRAAIQGRDTKAFPVRHHRRKLAPGADALGLYALYAASEPSCAASHYFEIDGVCSVGCSPENVFELAGDALDLDIVSGTGPRSDDPARDRLLADQLTSNTKELREHLLAVEQGLKRAPDFCAPASVAVPRRFELRQLARVRHLYSRITGRLRPGLDWLDVLDRYHPALDAYDSDLKSIADTMEHPHRFYGGGLGYLSEDGSRVYCYQNLRSCLIAGGEMHIAVGVGVTRLSDPDDEVRESHNKLAGLLGAIAAWERQERGEGG